MRSRFQPRRRRTALTALLGAGLLACAPVGAQALASAAAPAARTAALTFPNGYVSLLTCVSSSQCTAIAANGETLTFNPTRAGAVIHGQAIPASVIGGQPSIVCVTAHQCVAADAAGHVAVFDPRRPKSKPASFTMTGGSAQTSVSCPSHSRCVAETWQGESVFNPGHLGSPATSPFTANANGGQPSVSCPSANQCTGTNGNSGVLYTYNPTKAAAATAHNITAPQVGEVSCPTTTFCVALAAAPSKSPGINTGIMTFNPRRLGNPRVHTITASSLEFIACASTTLCAAAGNQQGVIVFNPQAPGRHRFTGLSYGNELVGIAFASRSELVLFGFNGTKAVINPAKPPKGVSLVGLSKGTTVKHG